MGGVGSYERGTPVVSPDVWNVRSYTGSSGKMLRKVIKLHGKRNSKLPWSKAAQPKYLVDVVDSDQLVVNKELSPGPYAGFGVLSGPALHHGPASGTGVPRS